MIRLSEDVHVLHGYTLADLDRMARAAMRDARAGVWSSRDRYQHGWDGIVDVLVGAGARPVAGYLIAAGRTEIERAGGVERHHHGLTTGMTAAPRHAIYWRDQSGPTPPAEERIVERLALAQIWATLSPDEREALTVLAVTNSQRGGAEMLGVHYMTVGKWVRRGRTAFLALWHEGETPSRLWRRDRRERRHDLAYTMAHSGTIRRGKRT